MRVLLEATKQDDNGLGVVVLLRYRHNEWRRTVWVPWKWLAVEEVLDQLDRELHYQRRTRAVGHQPGLPLENWE